MKISIAIVLFSAVSTHLFAQSVFPKVGVSSSWIATSDLVPSSILHLNDAQKMEMRIGFTAGIGFNFPVGEKLSIQPELSFIQKGTIGKTSGGLANGPGITYWEDTRDIKINYLEVPVLFKLSFGKKSKFFVNAGPALAMGLGGISKLTLYREYSDGETISVTREGEVFFADGKNGTSLDDEYFQSKFDFGFQVGCGILIIQRIMIDLRYTNGFTNLYDSNHSYENNSKNRSLQMTIGVPFKL